VSSYVVVVVGVVVGGGVGVGEEEDVVDVADVD
jgi:hypothetical protein